MSTGIEIRPGNTGIERSQVEPQNIPADGSLPHTIKEMQLGLVEIELALKRQQLPATTSGEKEKKSISSPLSVAIITGIIGLIAAAVAGLLQGNTTLKLEQKKFEFASQQEAQKNKAINELERQKFESTLVIKAIETGDPAVAARNLQFLIDARYLQDPGGEISKYVKGPQAGKGPVLPRPGTSILPQPGQKESVLEAKDPFGNKIRFQKAAGDDRTVKFLDDWEKQNITTVSIPQLIGVKGFPASGNIRFNKNAAAALQAAWAEIAANNLLDRVESWDGGYFPATIRGSNARLSSHAYGVSFNINVSGNFRKPAPVGTKGSVLELVPIFEKHGFTWGGNLRQPEPFHFQYKLPATK